MFNRLLKLPLEGSSSIFLFGPRATGKTAWLKKNVKNSIYIDLLDFNNYTSLLAQPTRLETFIPQDYKQWIIIDEIQRVPELLNEVHRLIETKKLRFILTGSSARSLRKQGVNLLAGRALTYHMHPLIVQEMGKSFNFNHALNYGMLPSAISHSNPQKYLESYVQTYIREEVLQEGLTRNIGAFSRFLEIAAFSQGNILTLTDIAREIGLNRLLIGNYFDILEDLLLAIRISSFSQRAKRKVIAHQKFYFFDTGVFRTIRPKGILDAPEEIDGAALETLFLQLLRAVNDYYEYRYTITFWHTQQGAEVDFIIYGERGLIAFEIKRTQKITKKTIKNLELFGQDYPEAKLYILYLGTSVQYHGSITAIPFVQALQQLPELIQ